MMNLSERLNAAKKKAKSTTSATNRLRMKKKATGAATRTKEKAKSAARSAKGAVSDATSETNQMRIKNKARRATNTAKAAGRSAKAIAETRLKGSKRNPSTGAAKKGGMPVGSGLGATRRAAAYRDKVSGTKAAKKAGAAKRRDRGKENR